MSLIVHTARIDYGGADRLDVTRKSAGPDGRMFAPSWVLLVPWRMRRREQIEPSAEAWRAYAEAYALEMRRSYRTHRHAWEALLRRAEVTLCCYCVVTPDRPWCHRRLLAGLLVECGATDAGER